MFGPNEKTYHNYLCADGSTPGQVGSFLWNVSDQIIGQSLSLTNASTAIDMVLPDLARL